MVTITIFSFELCSPLDPTNPFYLRHLIYVYTIYVSEKLGLEGGGAMFSRPWKISS